MRRSWPRSSRTPSDVGGISAAPATRPHSGSCRQGRSVEAPAVLEPEPGLTPEGTVGMEGTSEEEAEPLIQPGEPEAGTAKVKKSKVATKRLKKVVKEVKRLGVDVDVDAEGGDGA